MKSLVSWFLGLWRDQKKKRPTSASLGVERLEEREVPAGGAIPGEVFLNANTGQYVQVLHFATKVDRPRALIAIKSYASAMFPQLTQAQNPRQLAEAIRDVVAREVVDGNNMPEWQSMDAYERFLQAIVLHKKETHCQGRSWLEIDLLNAFGLYGREVGLCASYRNPANNYYYTHSAVEVWLNKRWVVMDATWDVSFTSKADGRLLGFAEMRTTPWQSTFTSSFTDWRTMPNCLNGDALYAGYLYRITYRPLWV